MKLKTLLSAALVSLSASAFAQSWTYDSVAMGAGYANDVYYEMKQGLKSPKAGNDWDLAFQTTAFGEPSFNASARANNKAKGVEVYSLHLQASAKFGNLTSADTTGKTDPAIQLYNKDTSWGTGAFYQNRLVTDPFSYGWGNYNFSNHYVTGDSLYLLKVGGVAYQFWLQTYVSTPSDSISYTFRIAKMDGTNDNTVKIYRKSSAFDFSNRLFAYYDIANNAIVNHEPVSRNTWDLMFTQYIGMVPGPAGLQPYGVTGVLTNLSTEVTALRHLDADNVTSANFKSTYLASPYKTTTFIDGIGYDWKSYDMSTNKYVTDDSGSYIIKSKNTSEWFQIQFTRFDGSSATAGGKIIFRKRSLGNTVGVPATAVQGLNAFAVSPNPTAAEAVLMLDAKKTANVQVAVVDMAGRIVSNATLDLKSGINAFSLNTTSWPAGVYAVQVVAQDWKASTRLVVAH